MSMDDAVGAGPAAASDVFFEIAPEAGVCKKTGGHPIAPGASQGILDDKSHFSQSLGRQQCAYSSPERGTRDANDLTG
jgi:hypothetical protein